MNKKRFKVKIERSLKSACIYDFKDGEVYMFVMFGQGEGDEQKNSYVNELKRVCVLLNELNDG